MPDAPAHRHRPHEGPLRVLVGKERFSENHAWSEMPVIISASHQAGQPPLAGDTVLRAMRPGAWPVNVARGALLDADAAIAHLNTGHLAGIGLDVFPAGPCPAGAPRICGSRP